MARCRLLETYDGAMYAADNFRETFLINRFALKLGAANWRDFYGRPME